MRNILLLVALALSPECSYAQMDEFRSAYEEFKNQAQKEYEDFRQKANAEYAEFVRKSWEKFKTLPSVPKPKDDKVPPIVIKEEDKLEPIEDKPVVIEEEITMPEPTPQPQPVSPIKEQPKPVAHTLTFSLYGTAMEVRAEDGLKFYLPDVGAENLAEAWLRLASGDYDNLICDCLELRIRHRLCDWAYLRMLDTMSTAFLGKGTNEAELLKAFVFCQSGYQMRLALEGTKLHMLYGSLYYIFDKPCWSIDGMYFYADDLNADRISICNAEFPHEQAMSLAICKEQLLAMKPSTERTIVSYDVPWMKASVSEDENQMDFYNEYPTSYFGDDFMTRWALYANTPMSKGAKDKLYPQLRTWIKDRDTAEAVDILCHWVQTAFEYEYDDKVWGGDRAFFPDETLYYPYCDCEDRSILLTRIVRDLLGLKCALVYYPGHLATAIAVGEDAKGDYF